MKKKREQPSMLVAWKHMIREHAEASRRAKDALRGARRRSDARRAQRELRAARAAIRLLLQLRYRGKTVARARREERRHATLASVAAARAEGA